MLLNISLVLIFIVGALGVYRYFKVVITIFTWPLRQVTILLHRVADAISMRSVRRHYAADIRRVQKIVRFAWEDAKRHPEVLGEPSCDLVIQLAYSEFPKHCEERLNDIRAAQRREICALDYYLRLQDTPDDKQIRALSHLYDDDARALKYILGHRQYTLNCYLRFFDQLQPAPTSWKLLQRLFTDLVERFEYNTTDVPALIRVDLERQVALIRAVTNPSAQSVAAGKSLDADESASEPTYNADASLRESLALLHQTDRDLKRQSGHVDD